MTRWGVEVLAATGRAEFIPALVEFLRFPWYYSSDEVNDAVNYSLKELAGVHLDTAEFDYLNAGWPDWLEYIGSNPDLRGPEGFTGWKGELFSRLVDPATGDFLYDGAPATIRVEEIAWGGVPKDGIPDLTNPAGHSRQQGGVPARQRAGVWGFFQRAPSGLSAPHP